MNGLKSNQDTDPKYLRVKHILQNGVEDEGGWLQKGCIIFSRYYDSAEYIARLLSRDLSDTDVGLYAGGDKSGVFKNGIYAKCPKDELKARVKAREMTIIILLITDASGPMSRTFSPTSRCGCGTSNNVAAASRSFKNASAELRATI